MDILFTIIASILLLVGFLVICRSSAESEDDYEEYDDEPETAHREATHEKDRHSG